MFHHVTLYLRRTLAGTDPLGPVASLAINVAFLLTFPLGPHWGGPSYHLLGLEVASAGACSEAQTCMCRDEVMEMDRWYRTFAFGVVAGYSRQ